MPVIKAFNLALLANPLGVLIAAVTAACLLLDDFMGFLDGDITALETFMKWCGLTSEEVDNIRQNILSFCRAVWNIPNNIKLALGEAWDVIKEMGAWFADLFHLPDAKAFTDFFAKVGDVAGSIGSTLWGASLRLPLHRLHRRCTRRFARCVRQGLRQRDQLHLREIPRVAGRAVAQSPARIA